MEGYSTRQLGCLKNVNVMKETKGIVGGTVGIIHFRSDSEGVNQPNEASDPDGVLDFFFLSQNKTAVGAIIIHLGNSEYGLHDDRLNADCILTMYDENVTVLNILVILVFGVFVV